MSNRKNKKFRIEEEAGEDGEIKVIETQLLPEVIHGDDISMGADEDYDKEDGDVEQVESEVDITLLYDQVETMIDDTVNPLRDEINQMKVMVNALPAEIAESVLPAYMREIEGDIISDVTTALGQTLDPTKRTIESIGQAVNDLPKVRANVIRLFSFMDEMKKQMMYDRLVIEEILYMATGRRKSFAEMKKTVEKRLVPEDNSIIKPTRYFSSSKKQQKAQRGGVNWKLWIIICGGAFSIPVTMFLLELFGVI